MSNRRPCPAPLLLASLCAAGGCASQFQYARLRQHVVSMDREGVMIDPESEQAYDGQRVALKRVFDQAELETREHQLLVPIGRCCRPEHHHPPEQPIKLRKLLIHVHGGLNGHRAALETATDTLRKIDCDREAADWKYAIFVHWNSDPLSCYKERAILLRNGSHYPIWGAITAPIFVGYDLARGVIRTPVDAFYMLGTDLQVGFKVGFDADLLPSAEHAEQIYAALSRRDSIPAVNPWPLYDVALGDYERGARTQAWRLVRYLALLPVKLVTTPLMLDGLGQGMWDVMLHRAHNALHTTDEFERVHANAQPYEVLERTSREPSGTFAEFVRALQTFVEKQERDDPTVCYEVTLVGHSMGTILINKALELDPRLPVVNLVYMAAACSVGEAEKAVVPFLRSHPQTQFYALTLHPIAEADEVEALDLTARGSLLEWVDNWYSSPDHPLDFRFGKWTNLICSMHIFRDVAGQVHVKGFGVHDGSLPQKHGDFNLCAFWKPEFWDPHGGSP